MTSAKNRAAATLSRAGTMVWLSVIAMAMPPLAGVQGRSPGGGVGVSPTASSLDVISPLVVAVGVGLGWHGAGEAALAQLLLELRPDERVLVGVLDLVAGPVLHLLGVAVELLQRVQGQVPRGNRADVEMLVEPLLGRHERARLVPRHDDLLLAFLPQDRVSLAGGNDDHAARAVAMRLLIRV